MPRLIGVDLFAGAGGLSLGFEQAGFDIVAAAEIDPVHCAAHKFNFPATAILPKSVAEISGQEIRDAAGIGNKTVDCVFGGPPCQGFSLIGHRSFEDPRNALVLDFVRLVAERWMRVPLCSRTSRALPWADIRSFLLNSSKPAIGAAGYEIRLPWTVLLAANFGVRPQFRERLILLGGKERYADRRLSESQL